MSLEPAASLVSIIIPCYNAERWVQEAVESCLDQSYPNIEIIVVDDGSTDRSLEILRRYLPHIKLETGPNRGGNCARNRGFALSSGEYVQYLDADDYLQPDKIATQVRFLEQTNADAVYGDFRYRRHLPDARFSYLDRVQSSGAQPDILASLLSFWVVNGGAILYRRRAIDRVGGWDETLKAAQDTDFLISVALSGATICYQPGCNFVYRKYGAVTVSTSNLGRWLQNMRSCLSKSETALVNSRRLTGQYMAALATGYFEIARACYSYDARASFEIYARTLDDLVKKILEMQPQFVPTNESRIFTALQRSVGLRLAMHLLFRVRGATNIVRAGLRSTFLFDIILRMRGVKIECEDDRRPAPDGAKTFR